ncbi:MAG: isoaspartyl peptidase/L-asparaginase [Henriciella sp.]|nr:isoaspartyl peptidase/L-asparaginase [Henriciella sp.]
MSDRPDYALAIHGGAGPKPGRDYSAVEHHLSTLIGEGEAMLKAGASAVDTVEQMVRELELSGLYVAGRGAASNAQGYVELDAAIMDGARMQAGAIAAARDLINPVEGARAVLEHTPHILLAGEGADLFCAEHKLARVDDPAIWYRLPVGVEVDETKTDELAHGTVGAVAMDQQGRLAAATSTGGLFGKRAGRVGDTPLIGIGNWADQDVCVSCTGLGEYFILGGVARDVAARMRYGGQSLKDACQGALDEVARLGGDGGLTAINSRGEIVTEFNSNGLKTAYVTAGSAPVTRIFS